VGVLPLSLQGTQRISGPLYGYRVIDCYSESQMGAVQGEVKC